MKQLASSIIVPYHERKREIVGVVGADFSLSFLHERMGKTMVFVNGYGELLHKYWAVRSWERKKYP
jgi:hypothetical protein